MTLARPSFYTPHGLCLVPQLVADLARTFDGMLEGDASLTVNCAEVLSEAGPSAVAFCNQKQFKGDVQNTHAGLLLVPFDFELDHGPWKCLLRVADPYQAMIQIIQYFHLPLVKVPEAKISWDAEVHPSAVVEGVVWPGVRIGPGCVVSRGAEIDWNVELQANVTVYEGVRIGRGSVIQAGVVLGSRGFGFIESQGIRVPVPHFAGVEIGENVEIGANTVVAGGFLKPTRLGNSCKIDTLVQIAHNCTLGDRVIMVSGSGLAGGVRVEDDVQIGGGAKVDGHLHIGQGARIAALSGVTKDIPAHAVMAGFPARPIQEWRKDVIVERQSRLPGTY